MNLRNLSIIRFFFKKDEELQYPYEFAEIVLNTSAQNNGISDSPNKLIIRYKYNERTEKLEAFRTYGYSDSMIKTLKEKLKIPIYDSTGEETQYPTNIEVNLSEGRYVSSA